MIIPGAFRPGRPVLHLVLSLRIQPSGPASRQGGVSITQRYYHSAVYEPDLDLVLLMNGIVTFGDAYQNDRQRLDWCRGRWLAGWGYERFRDGAPHRNLATAGRHRRPGGGGATRLWTQQWLGDASGSNPLIDVTMDGSKTSIRQFHTGSVGSRRLLDSRSRRFDDPNPGPVQSLFAATDALVRLGVYDLAAGSRPPRRSRARAGRHTAHVGRSRGGTPANAGIYSSAMRPCGTWTRRVAVALICRAAMTLPGPIGAARQPRSGGFVRCLDLPDGFATVPAFASKELRRSRAGP